MGLKNKPHMTFGPMDIIKDYFKNSSLHGLQYFTQHGRHWIERLFWLACVCASWYMCGYLIYSSYQGYKTNALSFGTLTNYGNWNTSLFSVAVCEQRNKIGVYALGEKLWGKERNYNLDEVLNDIAYFKGDHYFLKNFCSDGPIKLDCPKNDFRNLSNIVRSSCSGVFSMCFWNYRPFSCCQYFQPLDSERGLCFAINSELVKNPRRYPLVSNKISGPGSLSITLKVPAEVYIMAKEEIPFINAPGVEYVIAQKGLRKERLHSITEIINEPAVRDVAVDQRRCRFPEENPLTYFKVYSYMSCITECRIKKQLALCGCVSHLSPNVDSSLYCNLTGLLCLVDHFPEYSVLKNTWSTGPGLSCDCLPSCFEPEYDLIEERIRSTGNQFAIVAFSLQRLPSLRFKRTVVRGELDLVVSMGGSAGLFMGASLLSLVELFYFCIIRPYWNHYLARKALTQHTLESKKQRMLLEAKLPH